MPKNVGSIKTCSAEYPVGVGSSRLVLKSPLVTAAAVIRQRTLINICENQTLIII